MAVSQVTSDQNQITKVDGDTDDDVPIISDGSSVGSPVNVLTKEEQK